MSSASSHILDFWYNVTAVELCYGETSNPNMEQNEESLREE